MGEQFSAGSTDDTTGRPMRAIDERVVTLILLFWDETWTRMFSYVTYH